MSRLPAIALLLPRVLLLCLLPLLAEAAVKWEAVPKADLEAKACSWALGVDAEILRSEHAFDFSGGKTTRTCRRRIKVYTERGVDLVRNVGIDYRKGVTLKRLAGRLVRPDGGTVEFGPGDFRDAVLAKIGDASWRTRRLSLSSLQPGDVVEFTWDETYNGWMLAQVIYVQESLPVRDFEFRYEISNLIINYTWRNIEMTSSKPSDATGVLRAHHIRPWVEEPEMPPEFERRGYILLCYGPHFREQVIGWAMKAVWTERLEKEKLEVNSKIRERARAVVAGIDGSVNQLKALYAWCQSNILNLDVDTTEEAAKQRLKQGELRDAAAVLRSKAGTAMEINFLFAALVRAAGYEAHIANTCGRDLLRSPGAALNGWYYMAPNYVAVEKGAAWFFLNPGNPVLAFDELRWQEQGAELLVCGSAGLEWSRIPMSTAEDNTRLRTARLTLDPQGTLEGEVEQVLTGLEALNFRIAHWNAAPADIEKAVVEEFTARLPSAELSGVKVEGVEQRGKAIRVRHHVRVPQHAAKAEGKVFLIPNIFEEGVTPRYDALRRANPIMYTHAYSMKDEITVVLPEGLAPESVIQPRAVVDSDTSLRMEVTNSFDASTRTVTQLREFVRGLGTLPESVPHAQLRTVEGRMISSTMTPLVLKSEQATP